MYLLIPIPPIYNIIPLSYLHSTMYLLIPAISLFRKCFGHLFTFHYVSINSFRFAALSGVLLSFTFHYVSINSALNAWVDSNYNNLHSTMYLLILLMLIKATHLILNLHSTMYLLIPVIIKASLFLNSEALFCLPFKSANRLLILYALNMPEA